MLSERGREYGFNPTCDIEQVTNGYTIKRSQKIYNICFLGNRRERRAATKFYFFHASIFHVTYCRCHLRFLDLER